MANIKKTPGINGSSMADVSFILLIFFLMVTTMGTDYGLIRQLPPMQEKPEENPIDINKKNILVVNVNQRDELMVGSDLTDISRLREKTKDFFNINNKGVEYPDKKDTVFANIGNVSINKSALVSLQNDRGTSYKAYIQVQNELAGAVIELRNEFCMQYFGRKIDDCTQDQQDIVSKKIYPMSISEAEPKNVQIK
ncbi:MAG: biopolymer transporter ExbD [Bacteroidales bacterium]|jgi:biopolymer transport protein ExbD|nr:biopolymer transporter ExbD [Bacteroidales bacterium]